MAILLASQAEALIKEPKNLRKIKQLRFNHDWLRLHTVPFQEEPKDNQAYAAYWDWVKNLLDDRKYRRLKQVTRWPFNTVDITDGVFTELKRALYSNNGFQRIETEDESRSQEFEEYISRNKWDEWWINEGWELVQKGINSFIVCDMDKMNPEAPADEDDIAAYFYSVDPKYAHDFECYGEKIDYFIWREVQKVEGVEYEFFYQYDDMHYRVFTRKVGQEMLEMQSESVHGLGYCPVRSFWTDRMSDTNPALKNGPISKSLGKLNKYLFWDSAIEYYEMYGTFPILWMYKMEDGYDNQLKEQLPEGELHHPAYVESVENGEVKKDIGQEGDLIGPGTVWEVPAPASNMEHDLREPAGMIGGDVATLEYNKTRLKEREMDIFYKCVGYGMEMNDLKAFNELQISAGYENKKNILRKVAENYEKIVSWTYRTIANLIYPGSDIVVSISYGTDFYLASESDIIDRFKKGKDAGLSMSYLTMVQRNLIETATLSDPYEKQRAEILYMLEPYPEMSLKGMRESQLHLVEPVLYYIKANFGQLIRRFEMENNDVVKFGTYARPYEKIKVILQKLKDYANETEPERAEQRQQLAQIEGGAGNRPNQNGSRQ